LCVVLDQLCRDVSDGHTLCGLALVYWLCLPC
jgi:hypothetical protein